MSLNGNACKYNLGKNVLDRCMSLTIQKKINLRKTRQNNIFFLFRPEINNSSDKKNEGGLKQCN